MLNNKITKIGLILYSYYSTFCHQYTKQVVFRFFVIKVYRIFERLEFKFYIVVNGQFFCGYWYKSANRIFVLVNFNGSFVLFIQIFWFLFDRIILKIIFVFYRYYLNMFWYSARIGLSLDILCEHFNWLFSNGILWFWLCYNVHCFYS
jgi:hypothetical protein